MTEIKPWTLKNVPPEQRNAALAAAQREGVPIGVWVGRVCLEAAQRQATGQQLVPVAPPPETNNTLAVQEATERSPDVLREMDLLSAGIDLAAKVQQLKGNGIAGAYRRKVMAALERKLSEP